MNRRHKNTQYKFVVGSQEKKENLQETAQVLVTEMADSHLVEELKHGPVPDAF